MIECIEVPERGRKAPEKAPAEPDPPAPVTQVSPEELQRLVRVAEARRERRKPYMREYMRKRRAAKKKEAST
jgi:hypothetical protein